MNTLNGSEILPVWRVMLPLWAALMVCPLWVGCGDSSGKAGPPDGVNDPDATDVTAPTDATQPADEDAVTDAPDGVSPPLTVWSYLEARRAEVRQSPDHLVARAERLITGRDPAAIFAFVAIDGRSNWLEGAQLLALYVIIAVVFFFLPVPGTAGAPTH